jgi:hypothetical protein
MKKSVLSIVTAVAIGALAVPTFASAAQMHGNGGGRGSFAGSAGKSFSGGRSMSGTRNFAVNNNVGKFNNSRSFANPNRNANKGAKNWNGNKWAWNGRHHRRHHNGWWFPYAAVDAYAAYDYCWQTQWTPNGYQRVYVCGPDGYDYF